MTMEPAIMTSVVDYIYTGEIELTIDNVESLVSACDVLQLDGLKAGCEEFMMSQIDLTNCVGFFRCAALYGLHNVQRKAKELMLAEFKTVAFSDQFKQLSCSELIEHIKDDAVCVDDEDVVVECVLDWVRHDIPKRKSSFETILEYVRLPHCTAPYLRHMKDTCDLLTPKCVEYLHEATSFQADPVHQHQIYSRRDNLKMKFRLLVVGGLTCSEKHPCVANNVCQFYNEDTSCWEALTEMPPSFGLLYSVCYLGRSLLLTGGSKGSVAVDQCWLYDLATKKWEAMPPLIAARYFHRSVSLGGCAYVVGGKGVGDKAVGSIECLNLRRRQWSAMGEIPQAVRNPAVATSGNKVFVFGGRDAQVVDLCCTQVLDTTRDKWSTRSDSPEMCELSAAITLNDVMYMVGGGKRTCLKYDAATDSWTRLSRPRESHSNASAVVWRGCILVAGGGDPNPESSVIEQYDPLTDTWSQWKSELNGKLECHNMLNVDLYDV